MKKNRGLILFIILLSIFLFSAPLVMAFNDDILSSNNEPESIEELSSKIQLSSPAVSQEYATQLAEAIVLIRKLKREIYLTRQLIELREGEKEYKDPRALTGVRPLPKKEFKAERKKIVTPKREMPSYADKPEVSDFIKRLTRGKAPKEIVVAKQISEGAEEGISREEALIPGPEGEKRAREVSPPTPQPPRFKIYSKGELERGISNVVIEKEQKLLVPAVGLKRFMVTEPNVLHAERVDGKIAITGINLGRTFLHVWDMEGRRTVKFTVTQKGYRKFTKARIKAREQAKMDSFKVRYSYDQYRLDVTSKNASRVAMYDEFFHRLNITGQTPWGRTSSRFQYEGRNPTGDAEDTSDLTAWDFNLRSDDLEISLGNVGAYFSDITLPRTSFQGMRFKNPDKKDINYDLVWGARGNRMWGYRVLDWDTSNYFYGARGQIEPADFIHFNTTFLRATEYDDNAADYTYAGGVGLNFLDDAIKIEGEVARNESAATELHNHAYKVDTTLRLKDYNFTFKGTYRDIDPDFRLVTGTTAPNAGRLGCDFDLDYRPFKYIRVTGDYNVFRNRYSFNTTETQRYNYNWRGTVDFDISEDTRLKYAIWKRCHEGESTPSRGRGEMYQVSHDLLLPEPFRSTSLYFRYVPVKYKNLSDPTPNYREKKYTAGMRMNVLKNLYYDLSHDWHYRKMTDDAEHGMVKSLSTGVSYSTQILDTPFYGSANLRYKKEFGVIDNIRITSGENMVSGGGEIKYRPGSGFETYLRVNYKHIRGALDHDQNREEMRIYGGGSYYFDTTLRWGVGGSIRGVLFKDLNGNGKKDVGEEGISGVDIYAGEDYASVTDADGTFQFRSVKGYEMSVMYDPKMVPEGYKSTTPNPTTVALERDYVSEVYFGVMAAAEISGIVFHDVNMNGKFDGDDEGVRDVLIALDDGTMAQTMVSGHYRMDEVRPGTATITLDTMTLPHNLLPLDKAKKTIELKEGVEYKENFPLYALRTIVGTVFIDENDNGRFDAEEKGVADVVLRCRDSAAITDSNGRYFLKKLPGGTQEISLDIETIPPDYELAVEPPRTVELLLEGEIKEDVNFPLKKKQD